MQIQFANVASEAANNNGYLYNAIGVKNSRLFLGFTANLQGGDVTFINPYWASSSNVLELPPASRTNVTVFLSPRVVQLGARATVDFNGPSPRIKVSFSSLPARPLNLGTVRVGFKGVWPMKGTCYCCDFASQTALLQKQLEPFGAIVLRTTVSRIVANILGDAIKQGMVRIEAIDDLSREFIKDNLITDLCDLMFNDVGRRSVTLNPDAVLPDDSTNGYESNQDGIFNRDLPLGI